MPRNGSGTMVREGGTTAWVDDRNANTKIRADLHDTHDQDIADEISNSISKDGQTTTTAMIPFAAGLSVSDGAVGTPSITFSSDLNSGFYRIGADNIGLALNGAKVIDYQAALVTVAVKFAFKGTATNDSAASGFAGELITASVASGSAVSLTTATEANVTSISLTAGDWDVHGLVAFAPAGGTTLTSMHAAISTTSATLPTAGTEGYVYAGNQGTGNPVALSTGTKRISIASTTTVYLVARSAFGVSTMAAYGEINARRVR